MQEENIQKTEEVTEQKEQKVKMCLKCGSITPENAKFCNNCGNQLQ